MSNEDTYLRQIAQSTQTVAQNIGGGGDNATATNQQAEIVRLGEVRDRLPPGGAASEQTTVAILQILVNNISIALAALATKTDTQPVSGSVAINNLPATQPISGSVAVSNFPATQSVSATALPLPNGAATNTVLVEVRDRLPTTGIATGVNQVEELLRLGATNESSALSDNATSGLNGLIKRLLSKFTTTAGGLKVDGSGVTQPISGSVAVNNLPATQSVSGSVAVSNLPVTQPVSGNVAVNNFPATQSISATALPLPLGAASNTTLLEVRDRLPTGGIASETTLAAIKNALPSTTNSVLTRNSRNSFRDDFSGTTLSSKWQIIQTGQGQTISLGQSALTIDTGTTANSETIIRSTTNFKVPLRASFIFSLSQWINGQIIYLELVDTANNSSSSRAGWNISGSNSSQTVALLTDGGTSAPGAIVAPAWSANNQTGAEIELTLNEGSLYTWQVGGMGDADRQLVYTRSYSIPDPDKEYYFQIRVSKGSTNTSSIFKLDSISIRDVESNVVEISGGRGGRENARSISVALPPNTLIGTNINNSPTVNLNQFSGVWTDSYQSTTESTTPLVANAVFLSTVKYTSAGRGGSIRGWISSPQSGTLEIEQTINNGVSYGRVATIAHNGANLSTPYYVYVYGTGYRFRYTNGNQAQSSFALVSTLFSI